jgi:hypothetical protein
MLHFGVTWEGEFFSASALEDRIAWKPIFHLAKNDHLLSATTIENETRSMWIELHSIGPFRFAGCNARAAQLPTSDRQAQGQVGST